MLCERCGTDNPEGVVVCVQCYYAVGVPYDVTMKGRKPKGNGKAPAWATEMGLNEIEVRQVTAKLGDAATGAVIAYWFASGDEAAETQKALQDTIGQDIQAQKTKVAIFSLQGRSALFVAGKVSDPDTVRMVCDSFSGQPAAGAAK
ncbi:MAG: hypothetical protein HY321_01535 [Armatimonadetes bacterium]|nr:hypothetical protein [Armatimonadota bacterium]